MKKGVVYLVGAGPGDPGLLTLRGKELLSRADVVLYDALVHPTLLRSIPPGAKMIFRGSRGKRGAMSQAGINAELVRQARSGKTVVRLKGGDPFVFGRGGEEAAVLRKAGIRFEVVPGVTSAIAVPAYAGIPVTHRRINSSLTIVTGHEELDKDGSSIDWRNLALNNGTLVFLMGLHNLGLVCSRLVAEGKDPDTPAAVIQMGTTRGQRMVLGTLSDLERKAREASLRPPATVVVGKVVDLAPVLDWFRKGPLSGLRVLVTRGQSQTAGLSDLLSEKGAEVVEVPTIEIVPTTGKKSDKKVLGELSRFDWIVFSSVNAVETFMTRLGASGRDARALGNAKIACVGPSTAERLSSFGLRADLLPSDYKQEGLVKAFARLPMGGKKVLLAGASEGRDHLRDRLSRSGAEVVAWALYRNRTPKGSRAELTALFGKAPSVDLVAFASSSAAENFYRTFTNAQRRGPLAKFPAAVIGPVTGRTVRAWGGQVASSATVHTIPGLVAAIERWAAERRKTSRKKRRG